MADAPLILTRFATPPSATFGTLTTRGLQLVTLELPYRDNTRSISCVPPGLYHLEPHESDRYSRAWALVGDGVSHYEEPDTARYSVLLHAGNRVEHTHGCILPGHMIGWMHDEMAVYQSGAALQSLDALLRAMPAAERLLEIRYAGLGAVPYHGP